MRPLPPKHVCLVCKRAHRNKAGTDELVKHFTTCAECGQPCYADYLVSDAVWEATGLGFHGGVLHLRCLEKLINRSLTPDDFPDKPINDAIHWAFVAGQTSETSDVSARAT